MKAWIFSDLHLEKTRDFRFDSIPEADVCICAGDIFEGGPKFGAAWLGEHISPHMPVIFVPGERDYYGSSIYEGFKEAEELTEKYEDLLVIDGNGFKFRGYCFFGATLWFDYRLMTAAGKQLEEFRHIKLTNVPPRRFTGRKLQHLHEVYVVGIISVLRDQPEVPTVVITHHAPSVISVPKEWVSDPIASTLASPLEHFILEYEPLLWVHGHIHSPRNYPIGNTRVICNPRGRPGEPSNRSFVPNLVIDLDQLSADLERRRAAVHPFGL